jgi:hypothetical protein
MVIGKVFYSFGLCICGCKMLYLDALWAKYSIHRGYGRFFAEKGRSFRLRLHSDLRQQGDASSTGLVYGAAEAVPLRGPALIA